MQGDNWAELLKEVISFDSVEEFWGVYVSILMRIIATILLTIYAE